VREDSQRGMTIASGPSPVLRFPFSTRTDVTLSRPEPCVDRFT
jgi:hypothetical protein